MKQNLIKINVIAFLIIAIWFARGFFSTPNDTAETDETIGTFELNDYADEIELYQIDMAVNDYSSKDKLFEGVEKVWTELYGEKIKNEKPFNLSYDENSATWLIEGHRVQEMDKVAHIIINKKDGEVLAIWHD